MPCFFSPHVVAEVLEACVKELEPFLTKCKEKKGDLVPYSWSLASRDTDAMYEYRMILEAFLGANPCGVFKKTCMQAGLKEFLEKQHMHLLKGRKRRTGRNRATT